MSSPNAREPCLLGKGWLHSRDVIYLYATTTAANEANKFSSIVFRWMRGEWGLWHVPTRLCSIFTVGEKERRIIYCIGIDGAFEISSGNHVQAGVLDNSDGGPTKLRNILCAKPMDDYILAAGISRMVYRCETGTDRWTRFDEGMRVPRSSTEVAGFKSIDGDGQGRYVGVGFYGEIWVFDRKQWRQVSSPTNIKLEAVRWTDEGELLVVGGAGVLLQGFPDSLKVIDHGETNDTFWSIEAFNGSWYIATRAGTIWRWNGSALSEVELPANISTGWLHAADGALLSVGAHDVVVFDGGTWTAIAKPSPDLDWPLEW
jgi:hypothetical protein